MSMRLNNIKEQQWLNMRHFSDLLCKNARRLRLCGVGCQARALLKSFACRLTPAQCRVA